MVSKGFPNVTTSGRQYNFGEKPSVILYTYINLHAGTPKPQSFLSKSPGLQCSIGSERELYKYINHYFVLPKLGGRGVPGFVGKIMPDSSTVRPIRYRFNFFVAKF